MGYFTDQKDKYMQEHKEAERASFRGGMGNLDSKYAVNYGKEMKGKQSEEESDKDIRGIRDQQSYEGHSNESYKKAMQTVKQQYDELPKHKELINSIPKRK